MLQVVWRIPEKLRKGVSYARFGADSITWARVCLSEPQIKGGLAAAGFRACRFFCGGLESSVMRYSHQPAEPGYLFIDAGHLLKYYSEAIGEWFEGDGEIDFAALKARYLWRARLTPNTFDYKDAEKLKLYIKLRFGSVEWAR
jgi:hypothetical protein